MGFGFLFWGTSHYGRLIRDARRAQSDGVPDAEERVASLRQQFERHHRMCRVHLGHICLPLLIPPCVALALWTNFFEPQVTRRDGRLIPKSRQERLQQFLDERGPFNVVGRD